MRISPAQFARSISRALAVAALAAPFVLTTCGGGGGGTPKSPPAPLLITTSSLPYGIRGGFYSQTLQASGGTSPYSWRLTSGTLSKGMNLKVLGILAGIPAESGQFQFTAEVKDSASSAATATFALMVADPLVIPDTPSFNMTFNQPYNESLQATGGIPPYNWTATSGSLPSGLTLTSGGVFSGTPSHEGSFIVSCKVQDSANPAQSVSSTFFLYVWKNLAIPNNNLPSGVVTHAYHAQMEAFGGTPPYTWSLPNGSLPPGLALTSSTGEISGTPTQTNNFPIWIGLADSSTPAQNKNQWFYLTIRPTVSIASGALPDGVKDSLYSHFVYAADGQPPYSIKITSGALPPGLSLGEMSPYGYSYLTGTPTATGSYSFAAQVTDSSTPPDSANGNETIRVNEKLVITTNTLPSGMTGDPYTAVYAVTGGVTPYSYLLGALPQGLTFDYANRQITGIPTEPFDSFIYFQVWDSSQPSPTFAVENNFE